MCDVMDMCGRIREKRKATPVTAAWFEVRQIYAGLLNAARPLTPVLRILWLDTRLWSLLTTSFPEFGGSRGLWLWLIDGYHYWLLTWFRSWLSRSVHCYFNCFGVSRYLRRLAAYLYRQRKWFSWNNFIVIKSINFQDLGLKKINILLNLAY